MKLLILFIFIFTQWTVLAKTGKSKLKDKETNNYLASAKAKELEDQLSESEIFKDCKDNAANDSIKKVEACIQTKFSEINVDEFADKTDLKSFDLNASKNSTSIRKYLSERLSNALYGEAKKGKMKKLVDHEIYSKLYRSQVGKNILMEVSSYCLVNLGIKDQPNTIVNHCLADDGAYPKSCTAEYSIPHSEGALALNPLAGSAVQVAYELPAKVENGKYVRIYKLEKISKTPFAETTNSFWNKTYEYELNDACNKKLADDNGNVCVIKVQKSDGTTGYNPVRSSSFINIAKEVEFKLGPEYMRDKYKFCAFSAVKNMCEVYKCRNIYDTSNNPDKKKLCDDLGVTKPPKPDMTGHIACSLMAKLKQYRKNIATLDVIDEHNKGLRKKTGLSSSMYQGGFYQSGNANGEKSVEEITTISSSELAGKAKIGMSEDEIKELREECIATDGSLAAEEKCQKLVSDLDEDNAKNISADLESETQLYLKKISELEDPEDVKEYLIKHGLSRYISKLDDGTFTPQDLRKVISDEYKSEREALKLSMMEKFNRLTQKTEDPSAPGAPVADDFEHDKNVLAVESLDNIEKQKETIQTLFQYNNVISSYMSAQIGEGDDAESTELSYQRDIELEGMTKFGDESTQEKYEEYDKLLNEEDSRASSGNEQMNVDINFIDSLLGNTEDKKEE